MLYVDKLFCFFIQNIVAYHNESLPGHDVLVEAYSCMMDVADHLNEMKRNQERRAEIQKLLLGSSGMDLSSFGDLILEVLKDNLYTIF